MSADATHFETPLGALSKADWLKRIAEISMQHGHFKPLGKKHFAAFIQKKPTLVVTFETIQGIRALREQALPLGWDLVQAFGWSHLCLACDGDTWFRDGKVYGYFDTLIDEGFFDDFEDVIFYGARPCGYAAAAFSVAAPGARVVAIQPQATLDPRVTEWDERFAEQRRLDFNSRFGYAPDMLDAADHAFVLYDPKEPLDAMHAALFTRPNVTKFRMPLMGVALQSQILHMELFLPLLSKAAAGTLNTYSFAQMYRTRRTHRGYLRNLLAQTDLAERFELSRMICENITATATAPHFARRLAELNKGDATTDAAGSSED